MSILSWGSNSHGQLGQGIESEQTVVPTPLEALNVKANQITGGGKHSVIVSSDCAVYVSGDNDKSQLGCDSSVKKLLFFKKLICDVKIVKVSCGWDFNLALNDQGEVLGWGSNSFGQLGLPREKKVINSPVKVNNITAIDISCGLRHSGIVSSDGFIYTTGAGKKGQLGIGIHGRGPIKVEEFQQVLTIKNAVAIACGENHCIALTSKREIFAWGSNKYGQLGINPNLISSEPTPVKVQIPSDNIKEIFSGWTHNVVVTDDGKIITWGRNDYGQLGESRVEPFKPEFVMNLPKIKQCAVGSHHMFVLDEDNVIWSWGWNEHGNCGNGELENVFVPVRVDIKGKVSLIGTGAAHSFAQVM